MYVLAFTQQFNFLCVGNQFRVLRVERTPYGKEYAAFGGRIVLHAEIAFAKSGYHVVAVHDFALFGHGYFIVKPFGVALRKCVGQVNRGSAATPVIGKVLYIVARAGYVVDKQLLHFAEAVGLFRNSLQVDAYIAGLAHIDAANGHLDEVVGTEFHLEALFAVAHLDVGMSFGAEREVGRGGLVQVEIDAYYRLGLVQWAMPWSVMRAPSC